MKINWQHQGSREEKTNRQIIVHKTQHRRLRRQHKPQKKLGVIRKENPVFSFSTFMDLLWFYTQMINICIVHIENWAQTCLRLKIWTIYSIPAITGLLKPCNLLVLIHLNCHKLPPTLAHVQKNNIIRLAVTNLSLMWYTLRSLKSIITMYLIVKPFRVFCYRNSLMKIWQQSDAKDIYEYPLLFVRREQCNIFELLKINLTFSFERGW